MAKKDSPSKKKPAKTVKTSKPTMRQLGSAESKRKPRILKQAGGSVGRRLKKVSSFGAREYHPIKLPDNKAGRILGKRVRIMPKFFREAWAEIRQVTWPGKRETYRLTSAVFIFSLIFAIFVALLDFGLDKIFKEIIVK